MRAYDANERIVVADTPDDARRRLVADWWSSLAGAPNRAGEAIMLAVRRSDVEDLNGRARELMRAAGALGLHAVEARGREYAEGDRVICLRNRSALGVLNGTTGRVALVDHVSRSLRVLTDDGSDVLLTAAYLDDGHLSHGYAITGHKAQGSRDHRKPRLRVRVDGPVSRVGVRLAQSRPYREPPVRRRGRDRRRRPRCEGSTPDAEHRQPRAGPHGGTSARQSRHGRVTPRVASDFR